MKTPSVWTHWANNKTGNHYFIQHITNTLATREGWPVMVIYTDDAGAVWSRPATEWVERYTEINNRGETIKEDGI